MRAQLLTAVGHPLVATDVPAPRPGPGQLLIQVRACAVCRTDLHVVDGELPDPKLPLIPGHEIVGTVVDKGRGRRSLQGRRPGRRAVARLDLRRVRVLPRRPRKPLRPGPLHRLPDRRRLCRADRRRSALLLRPRPRLRRCRGGAAAVRRAYRLPHLAACGRRRTSWASTASARPRISSRKSRAIRAGRSSPSPARATGRHRISRAASALSGPAAPTRRRPSRSTPR